MTAPQPPAPQAPPTSPAQTAPSRTLSNVRRYAAAIFGALAFLFVWLGHTLSRAAYGRGTRTAGWVMFILGLAFGVVAIGIAAKTAVDDEDMIACEARLRGELAIIRDMLANVLSRNAS